MANNDDLYSLVDSTEGPDEASGPKGTVFINNTSYSGADIKLVVHVYDTAASKKERLETVTLDLEAADARGVYLLGKIEEIQTSLAAVHTGTPEEQLLKRQLNKLRSEMENLTLSLDSINAENKLLQSQGPTASTLVLADIQTISISTHRDKRAIRALGRVYPVAFSRGQREIAGSMVFTVFNEAALYKILEAHPSDFDAVAYTSALMDQLPPIDITIAFANEYGQTSRMAIYGVEFLNEGTTMSIEDIMTENVCNYVARDFDPLRRVAHRKIDEASRMVSQWAGMKASDLILENEFQNDKSENDPFMRFYRRSNPFL